MKMTSVGVSLALASAFLILTSTVRAEASSLDAGYLAILRSGDVPKLRSALDRGASANARDAQGSTPLMFAAIHGDVESLRLLLDRGADINATNKVGATALMRAASDHAKVVLLLERGADVRVRSAFGNTALLLAARPANSHRTVKLLIDRGADAKVANVFGATALMAAAAGGDEETVRLLLKHGADPNAQAEASEAGFVFGGGRSPLMWAAFRGNEAVMKQLIAAGADVEAGSKLGTPLAQAAWADRTAAAQLLIKNGADVNRAGPADGYTALHWAASTENTDAALVKLLLKHKADPDFEGGAPIDAFMGALQTPVMLARLRGETPILAALSASATAQPQPERRRAITPPNRDLPEQLETTLLRDAIRRALVPLQLSSLKSKESFVRHSSKQDCTSCHQQHLPMAAIGLARKQSVPVDTAAERELIKMVALGELKDFEPDWQPLFHPDLVLTKGYTLLGYAAQDLPPDELTDSAVFHLAVIQGPDGQWYNNLPRPPIQTGDIGATALAVHALQRYPLPGRKAEFASRVDRARRWLWNVSPQNTDSRIFQLLGLAWAGEPAHKLAPLTRALLAEQRADGGWAQLPALSNDAYATGQALYALHVAAGMKSSDPAIDRGRHFLLRTQLEDGTWHVRRRAFPFQPTMPSGFPHGRDSWISAAATSWAVMALSLPDSAPIVTAGR
jgi:ankyrin repeat protein